MHQRIQSMSWLDRLQMQRTIRLSSTSNLAHDLAVSVSEVPRARRKVYVVTLLASAVGACAGAPIASSPDMVRAEVAIAQAQKAGAGDIANDSLQAAQRNLDEAKSAAAMGEGRRSQYLVDESMADAQLADLTAQSVNSSKAAAEVEESINAIRSEADRRVPQ